MKIPRGFHYTVENRAERVHEASSSMPFRGAFLSRIIAADGDSEKVKVASVVGQKTGSFAYPFASRSAWIRGQPEISTNMISIIGGDTNDVQPVGYYDPLKSGAAATYRNIAGDARQNPGNSIQSHILPYRSLAPGELDIASLYAQTFFGKKDVHSSRGGLSHFTMSSIGAKLETAQFTVEGPAHQLDSQGTLNDEVRFGTVRRARTIQETTNSPKSTATMPSLVKGPGINTLTGLDAPFAKEWSVLLNWHGAPNRLIDHRQGIVVEDNGDLATSTQTSKNLRARMRWYTVNDGLTSGEIDEKGNVVFTLAEQASQGMVIAVPGGDVNIKVGGQQNIGGGGGKFSLKATNDVQLNTDKKFAIVVQSDMSITAKGRGEIKVQNGLGIKSQGVINIDAAPMQGITLGNRESQKYPVLVAHPEYLSTLNGYYSSQVGLSSALAAYGGNAAAAWSAIGPLTMLLDPSGSVMGLCLAAAASAGTVASQAPTVGTSVGQHLPRLALMPAGFLSKKTVSE